MKTAVKQESLNSSHLPSRQTEPLLAARVVVRGGVKNWQDLPRRLEAIFIISFVVILVLLPVHAFLSTWLGTSIGPLLVWKSWKEVLLTLLVPLVASYCFMRPEVARLLWARLVNKLIVVYVVLHGVLALAAQASNEAVMAGMLMNLRFLAMFMLGQCIMASGHPWVERIKHYVPQWLLWTTIVLSVLAIVQVAVLPPDFLQYFGYSKDITIAPATVVDDNPDLLRAFATMRGPNTLGAYLLISLAFALYFLFRKRHIALSATALGLGGIALVLTGSRSAWLGFAVMAVVLAVLLLPRRQVLRWARIAFIPVVLLGVVFLWASTTLPALRLAVFHSSPGDPYLIEGSTEEHWNATIDGIRDIATHPLGTGPGSAGPASFYNGQGQPVISENYFVQVGQEVGMLGLFLFVAINSMVAVMLLRSKTTITTLLLASFAGLTLINIFQHGWADDPTAMTWWGLTGLFIAPALVTLHNKTKA